MTETAELSATARIAALEALPPALRRELSVMRREPAEFAVVARGICRFCTGSAKTAYWLSHPLNKDAGSWCPEHGFLSFDSNTIRPIGEEYIPKKRKLICNVELR